MNKKQKSLTNKGFSLVELIIVIAIMAVLVGVLAPQFIKYVEQSRRSTDIQNAENIKTAILADIADGKITANVTTATAFTASTATTIKEVPSVKGNLVSGSSKPFYYTCNVTDGTCSVYPDSSASYDLTTTSGADSYKKATSGGTTTPSTESN